MALNVFKIRYVFKKSTPFFKTLSARLNGLLIINLKNNIYRQRTCAVNSKES